MLKILINAYACSPHTGSEPGMGWNWCANLARYCEVHIITEGEFRGYIEEALKTLPQASNMYFYYNPVSDEIRNMCWNQGDWRFYGHYKKWQYQTYKLAVEIVKEHNIDILHQLNMIGFREPGYLWKIKYIPLIWGPIGGLKQFPVNYLKEAGLKFQLFNRLKNFLNICQLRFDSRVNKALRGADVLISSIPDSYKALKTYKGKDSLIIPETGSYPSDIKISTGRFFSKKLNILWVGKFDFRKQLPLALKSIAQINNPNIILHVVGSGTKQQEASAKLIVDTLGIKNQVVFYGNCPNAIVLKKMKQMQLFFFTSVSEDTSTVVMEAISNQLPVLCFDTCGFGAVINDRIGVKIKLTSPEKSVLDFSSHIDYLSENRHVLKKMSINCIELQKELSWDNKARKVIELYRRTLNKRLD
ncbi:Glycosyltransferase involved in cell wall bisynthesis [Zunongwangia mangrovi]|uniref:Glycosyltransferase involved in cell wall bisynthesis n=1 Tax=Zunongwangia mangrovi TaxID=1334022 RepID=A0A1I1D485_9FLAO|nr:glycosyltransferase [Zunongwangia mangrovi]SFB69735.1 Glycosyltransferase involved in cell wall bisynthesis [Zunongwangia mangrovi]